MEGQVRVLLVKTEEIPDGLKEELIRLGVSVDECGFVDAEEVILDAPPDLVALAGARGAVELSTILEDIPSGPRMVIVAERRELAKLRGLNREVVVSLFAVETTEKVVGQRIESLARRAARKKIHAAGGSIPPQKKTALGLPTGTNVAKVGVMRSPPGVSGGVREEGNTRMHPAAEPTNPPPAHAERVSPVEPPPVEEKKREEQTPSPRDVASPEPARRPAPPRPFQQKVTEEVADMLQVLDEELLESIAPSSAPPQGGGTPVAPIPPSSRLPTLDDNAPMSIPPTLPPAAKTQSDSRITDIKLIADPGELDISSAEDALDNIDSIKMALTEELVRQARENMAREDEKPRDSVPEVALSSLEEIEALSIPPEPDPELKSETDAALERAFGSSPPPSQEEVDDAFRAAVVEPSPTPARAAPETQEVDDIGGMEIGDRPTTGDLLDEFPLGATVLAPERKSPEPQEKPREDDLATMEREVTEAPVDEQLVLEKPQVSEPEKAATAPDSMEGLDVESARVPVEPPVSSGKKTGGGSGLVWGTAAVVLVGGLIVLKGGVFGIGSEESPTSHAPPGDLPAASSKASSPPPAPPSEAKSPSAVPSEEPPSAEASEGAAKDAAPASAEGEEPSPSVATGAHSGIPRPDEPFFVPDSNAPTCDALLAQHKPDPGTDPLKASSDIWAEARKNIVAAELDQANIQMCQAVALYPESAAVEGLAHLYLRLRNTKEALKWGLRAEELRPGQLDIGYLIGDAYAFQGDLEKARGMWLKTLNVPAEDVARIPPISKDYSVEAGRHLRRGDYHRAELFFRRSIILDPQNLTGIIGLAKTYQKLEMPNYTRTFAEMSLKITDVMPEVHVLLGELALEEGNKAEAKERFERALAVRPGFFPAKRGLSQVQ